jgi:hypothetical protein
MLTIDLQQPAPRPLKGGLRNEKFMRAFPFFAFQSVDNFLEELVH